MSGMYKRRICKFKWLILSYDCQNCIYSYNRRVQVYTINDTKMFEDGYIFRINIREKELLKRSALFSIYCLWFDSLLYCLGSRETAILAVSGGGTLCCGASAFYTSSRGVSTAHALSQRTPDLVAQRLSQPLSPRALVPLPLDPHSPITYLLSPRDVCLRQCHHHSLSENVISLLYPR